MGAGLARLRYFKRSLHVDAELLPLNSVAGVYHLLVLLSSYRHLLHHDSLLVERDVLSPDR
jgi:hypothetical protein